MNYCAYCGEELKLGNHMCMEKSSQMAIAGMLRQEALKSSEQKKEPSDDTMMGNWKRANAYALELEEKLRRAQALITKIEYLERDSICADHFGDRVSYALKLYREGK